MKATVTTGAKPHGQQQLARDLEVERAVMEQRCRPQSFGEVHRCLYSSSTTNERTEEMGTFFLADRFFNPKTPIEPGGGRRVGYHLTRVTKSYILAVGDGAAKEQKGYKQF